MVAKKANNNEFFFLERMISAIMNMGYTIEIRNANQFNINCPLPGASKIVPLIAKTRG